MAATYYSRFKKGVKKRLKKYVRSLKGDYFDNAGAVTEADFIELKKAIDQVNPRIYIEIGTGRGISASRIFSYMKERHPQCDFYTIDIFKEHADNIRKKFEGEPRFHALLGLSVMREETTDPARSELRDYKGPQNVLRELLRTELGGKNVDVAFIDSRKGSALAEFHLLLDHLAPGGIILCHDILNRGKGVEVLLYLQEHKQRFDYDILDTGPAGMLRIRRK